MFIGAQASLHPLSDRFVDVILSAIGGLDPYRDRLRIETDDLSTLMVGPPEPLFDALRDLFTAAAGTGVHTVLHATISRGCPGEPDDPVCRSPVLEGAAPSPQAAVEAALEAVRAETTTTGIAAAAQISLYPLGTAEHMDQIAGCIDFLRRAGVFDRSKNFCTRLGGDAGLVFPALRQSFLRFGHPAGHVAMTATVSANSPSRAG